MPLPAPSPTGLTDPSAKLPSQTSKIMPWPGPGWAPPLTQRFLSYGRNWKSVEHFYQRLVAGQACLSELGLIPAGQCMNPYAATPAGARTHQPHAAAAAAASAEAALQGAKQQAPAGSPPRAARAPAAAATAAEAAPQATSQKATGTLAMPATCNTGHWAEQGDPAAHQQPTATDCAPPDRNAGSEEPAAKRRRLDRGRRETFKVCLSYYGPSFEGWAWAKERQRTVAGELDRALRAVSVKGKHRQVNINGAGRTDKGVSACGQVFSFTTWDEPQPAEVLATINRIASDQLCAWAVQRVPNSFHATFQSTWRRYIYLFPLRTSAAPNAALLPQHVAHGSVEAHHTAARCASMHATGIEPAVGAWVSASQPSQPAQQAHPAPAQPAAGSSAERTDAVAAQQACDSSLRSRTPVICPHTGLDLASVDGLDVRTEDVDRLLRQLEGQKLNCTAYARDTPKGKDCSCHILTARASQVMLPGLDGQPGTPAVCIELVANRFLRKMVRVLAATAIREAVPAGAMVHEPQAPDQALVRLAQKLDRVLTAPFAPAVGLCFAGAGYPGSAVPA